MSTSRGKYQANRKKLSMQPSQKGNTFALCAMCHLQMCKIAEKFSFARTKMSAIVTHAMPPAEDNTVTKACSRRPFSLLCDGGNNMFEKKHFGIMVWYWEEETGDVMTRFLDMPLCNVANSQTVFDCMDVVISKRGIPCGNAIGFASDRASVMIGKRNDVLSRIHGRRPNIKYGLCLLSCCLERRRRIENLAIFHRQPPHRYLLSLQAFVQALSRALRNDRVR